MWPQSQEFWAGLAGSDQGSCWYCQSFPNRCFELLWHNDSYALHNFVQSREVQSLPGVEKDSLVQLVSMPSSCFAARISMAAGPAINTQFSPANEWNIDRQYHIWAWHFDAYWQKMLIDRSGLNSDSGTVAQKTAQMFAYLSKICLLYFNGLTNFYQSFYIFHPSSISGL